ncbi:glycosyltransferase family 61 protein [Paenibacillus popilliae]|uniref:Glycosyltransferase family 61 protein n=1 Tax=Paenibacillus popilliae TaxID=78057 RepID=A0ABY3AMA0_PAEPP|nr:glycosyltransferase family 61 protein [Paenibacillus sp. SDF0028]TQR43669.1 glycosyltransferase family 61 protein [Paenibacillus sp. SDF0028]
MNIFPNQTYQRTRDWAAGAALNLQQFQEMYRVLYPAETIILPPPKGVDTPRWGSICHFDEAFVAVIPGGRVMTGSGHVVTPDHRRLQDVELPPFPYPFNELPEPQYTSETVATLMWGWNVPGYAYHQAIFGHWFFDYLTRIHLLEQSGIAIDKYLVGQLTHSFQYESLQMLGFPMEKLIQVDRNDFHLVANKLVVPAVPFLIGGCPSWASQYIRTRLKNASIAPRPGYERIYVSRQDAFVRHVINEEEVMQVLAEKGFVRIVLTPLSTAEKIAIYSSAQVIVSPFGSGSINTVFCNPGSTLIELTPLTVMDSYFWKISNYAGMNYYEVLCNIEQPPKPLAGFDNLIVDIDKLKRVLHMAGI